MTNEINYEKLLPCQIPHLNLSCFGCCGRNFKSKHLILKQLNNNTNEFNSIIIKSTLRLLQFRDRLSEIPFAVTESGLCSNIIKFKNGIIACPLHPKINEIIPNKEFNYPNKKLDLRINHCDVNYECETFKVWLKMTIKERKKLIKYIEKQKFDNYNYSIQNGDDLLIKNFLNLQ